MPTTIPDPPQVAQLVDEDTLICPGCHEQIRPEPPTALGELDRGAGPEFCHRDGSELCHDSQGRMCDPIEDPDQWTIRVNGAYTG